MHPPSDYEAFNEETWWFWEKISSLGEDYGELKLLDDIAAHDCVKTALGKLQLLMYFKKNILSVFNISEQKNFFLQQSNK